MHYSLLERRAVFGISGKDRYSFMQSIITNDIYKLAIEEDKKLSAAIYGLILTPQGKLLYDLFIIEKSNVLLIDCPSEYIADIISFLKKHKLHAKVEIMNLQSQMKVIVSFQYIDTINLCFSDPRNPAIGYRGIVDINFPAYNNAFICEYEDKRISLLIPDATKDFLPMQFFPSELGMDFLNAIDYRKGCYIGQEVTAKIKYRGKVKRKLCLIILEDEYFKNVVSNEYNKFKILSSSNKKKALAMVDIDVVHKMRTQNENFNSRILR